MGESRRKERDLVTAWDRVLGRFAVTVRLWRTFRAVIGKKGIEKADEKENVTLAPFHCHSGCSLTLFRSAQPAAQPRVGRLLWLPHPSRAPGVEIDHLLAPYLWPPWKFSFHLAAENGGW